MPSHGSGSMNSVLHSRQAPLSTMASWPVPLPESANPDEIMASLSRPVRGDLLSTAALAEVLSEVPARGAKANTSGASEARAS